MKLWSNTVLKYKVITAFKKPEGELTAHAKPMKVFKLRLRRWVRCFGWIWRILCFCWAF